MQWSGNTSWPERSRQCKYSLTKRPTNACDETSRKMQRRLVLWSSLYSDFDQLWIFVIILCSHVYHKNRRFYLMMRKIGCWTIWMEHRLFFAYSGLVLPDSTALFALLLQHPYAYFCVLGHRARCFLCSRLEKNCNTNSHVGVPSDKLYELGTSVCAESDEQHDVWECTLFHEATVVGLTDVGGQTTAFSFLRVTCSYCRVRSKPILESFYQISQTHWIYLKGSSH